MVLHYQNMMRSLLIVLLLSTTAQAQPVQDQISEAVFHHIAVWKEEPVRHCRHAPEGCEARVQAFAEYFVEAGKLYDLDPWLLTAVALRESGMNPFARGHHAAVPLKEGGVMQINPCRDDLPEAVRYFVGSCYRSRHVIRVRHMRQAARYREKCKDQVGACQRDVILHAASILRRSIEWCGSVQEGLTAYNSGRCGVNGYSRRVLRLVEELKPGQT